METPAREGRREGRRRFNSEEKKQLLANLDIEVAHRTRQFEQSLAQILENFMNHHEGQVLRVPKLVRNITMAEFADKYNGDINECLRGLQRDKQGGEPSLDPALRKRKWKESEETSGPEDMENRRTSKTARFVSPVKMNAAKILKARLNKTPGPNRTARNLYPTLGAGTPSSKPSRTLSRFMSPTKASSSKTTNTAPATTSRVPSSSHFNPVIPKTPAYPRAPRKNESLMSINGSPISYPVSLRNGFARDDGSDVDEGGVDGMGRHPVLRKQRSIVIRKDLSFKFAQAPEKENHQQMRSRTGAHSSSGSASSTLTTASTSTSTSATSTSTTATSLTSASSTMDGFGSASKPSALIRVPTKDGLILEFDPLLTTPEELDTLEGITDEAKKQAREDMTKLVQAALARWKL